MSIIKRASRSEVFLKLGVTGPSGSGKSYSALLLAKGLMGGTLENTVVIDTENGSANLYSDLGEYSVLPFDPPYDPKRYANAINLAVSEGFKCIIIDSISHEWEGAGGCLDIHAKLGGKFSDWALVTPMHKAFIDSIMQAKAHVIVTMRKKQEHAMVEKNGKKTVEKMGLKEVQRDGFEYELTTNFDINMDHLAVASKDRTGMFDTIIPFMIEEKTGVKLKNWNENAKPKGEMQI